MLILITPLDGGARDIFGDSARIVPKATAFGARSLVLLINEQGEESEIDLNMNKLEVLPHVI